MRLQEKISALFNEQVLPYLRPALKAVTAGVGAISLGLQVSGTFAAAPLAMAAVTGVALLAATAAVTKQGRAVPARARGSAHGMAVLGRDGRFQRHSQRYTP